MVIAIDFDGTIVEHKWPEIGSLRKNAKTVINRLYDAGAKIIIWTCRTQDSWLADRNTHQEAIDFLKKEGIKFHEINKNVSIQGGFNPSPKIYADLYIDDRQLGGIPDDWEEIYKIISDKHV